MPYIDEGRERFDMLIKEVVGRLSEADERDMDGLAEYVLYQILKKLYFAEDSRFFDMNRGVGLLETTKRSLERDHLDPYEKRKLADRWSGR